MKKFKLSKLASILLVSVLTLSACNNSSATKDPSDSGKETGKETGQETTEATTDSIELEEEDLSIYDDVESTFDPKKNVPNINVGLPLTDEPVKYTAMISYALGVKDPNEMALYQERAKETGVNIEYDWVLESAKAERLATTLASGDLPDVFVNMGISMDQLGTYGDTAGLFMDITDYAKDESIMPNLKWIFEQHPEALAASVSYAGKLYGVPRINNFSVWPGNGIHIRDTQVINAKWLDKLGLDMPETIDDFVEVLTAFKNQDPNGNGEQDEIPLSFNYNSTWTGSPESTLFGPFGFIGNGTKLNIVEGDVIYGIQHNNYVEAIQYINKLWSNGLIDAEAFTHENERYIGKGQSETPVYGVAIEWTGTEVVGDRVALELDEKNEYVPLPPLKGPNGERLWRNELSGLARNKAIFSAKAENPELLMKYFDYLYTPDNSIQETYGMFDRQTYKVKEGLWAASQLPKDWTWEEWLRESSTREMPYYVGSNMAENKYNEKGEGKEGNFKYKLSSIFAPYAQDLKDVYTGYENRTPEESEIIDRLEPQIKNAIIEQEVKWIMGEGDVTAEYDAFINSLESLGLSEVLKQYQATRDRYTSN